REAGEGRAGLEPVPQELPAWAARALPDLLHGVRLGAGEARAVGRRAGLAALQDMRIEMAGARVADDAVGHAVESVAGLDRRDVDRVELRLRHRRADGDIHRELGPELRRDEAVPVEGGRAGEDAVVIVGEALRLHPALPAAGRAAVPVGIFLRLAVIGLDERLGLH